MAAPSDTGGGLPSETILNTFPYPILVLDGNDGINYANPGAEQFFATGAAQLCRNRLSDLLPFGSPAQSLVQEARQNAAVISEYGIDLGTPRLGPRLVDVTASPVVESPDCIVLTLRENSIASKMDRQLTHRGAARSVTGMAAMLAHEVKNPLSGIRGAAQLLEQNADSDDRVLTRLICDETDRIVDIVERMEMFSDKPIERQPVNIHRVLERVRQVAQSGFAKNIRFQEKYDPSIPPVRGNFDQLVQVFLNLVKNAAEAAPAKGGEITLSTAYRHGLRLTVPGSQSRMKLPIEITVHDNGPGVSDDIRPYLFDAFVTNKAQGSGLGLALVAKVVDDHGGVVECAEVAKGTEFRVMLPMDES
ncbi:MAG: ATP-binding protein [Alphaproteobacteria bacterium]|jgi:two-component system nitrogen regulation sensor histidine kinase GlnL|nr:ATP-binding protein [Alphaproteobacteria bacterium]MDP6833107.1 ATP-binding protein [Alphaproteobacteria bacterium]